MGLPAGGHRDELHRGVSQRALLDGFFADSFRIHKGTTTFRIFGPQWEPLLSGMAVLWTDWLVLFWRDRRKSSADLKRPATQLVAATAGSVRDMAAPGQTGVIPSSQWRRSAGLNFRLASHARDPEC